MNFPTFRQLCALGFLGCCGGMAFALYLEHFRHLEPCAMCIFQRVAMIAAGFVFLAGAIHGPKGLRGQRVYSRLAALASLAGIGLAARHVWLQSLPPDQVPACGPTLDYMMEILPFKEVVEMVLKGDGECAKINAEFLMISLPAWTLLAFIGFAAFALAMPRLARTPDTTA
jgi:disulfide bond formation protein DsbB